MTDTEYLDNYEHMLEDGLLKICRSAGLLKDEILRSPDIDAKWDEGYARDYVADAVTNFNGYPEAAIAWAGFLGMAVAHNWDAGWELHSDDAYSAYYGSRGWDDLDEHVLEDVLGLGKDSSEASLLTKTLLSCAVAVLTLIRHEGIETQTERGFYVLARSYTSLYRIGAAIELTRLGYKKVLLTGA